MVSLTALFGALVYVTANEFDATQEPLHFAAEDGDVAAIHTLLQTMAADTATGPDRLVPLHVAAHQGHAEVIDTGVRRPARHARRLGPASTT